MGIEQTPDGVGEVRQILAELPARHYAQDYIRAAEELKHDAALVDTFLHPQDRAYTVPQLFDLIEGAGLAFQNWLDNAPYWRNGEWGPDSAVAAAVDPLPQREHWAAVEMLRLSAGLHMCTVRHPAAVATVDFDGERLARLRAASGARFGAQGCGSIPARPLRVALFRARAVRAGRGGWTADDQRDHRCAGIGKYSERGTPRIRAAVFRAFVEARARDDRAVA